MQIFLHSPSFVPERRCEAFAKYIIANNATVRDTAAYFGASKSTVHKDVTEKLRKTNQYLFEEVRKILSKNKSERHLRGGNATRLRYENLKHEKNQQKDKMKRIYL